MTEITSLEATARRRMIPHAQGWLTWREWGDGQPLVLLHGSHGSWMHWLRNIEELSRGRRVVVPDLPGFGDSDPPEDLDSPVDHGRLLAQGLRDVLGASIPVDVVAFSLGMFIGGHVAAEFPGLVRRLIAVDAGGLGTAMRTPRLRGAKGLKGDLLREVNRHNLAAMMLHDPARIDEAALEVAAHGGRRARTRVQYHVVPDKLLPVLSRIRAPIDAIWGEHDWIHPDGAANAAVIRRYDPFAELRVIEGAGHWAMYEQPAAFNAAVLDLLSRPARALRDQPSGV